MTTVSSVFVPRIAGALPSGWAHVEVAELVAPSGESVRVIGAVLPGDSDSDGLARMHAEQLASELDDFRDGGVVDRVSLSGREVRVRTCTFTWEGRRACGVHAYGVFDGVGYVASGTAPDESGAADRLLSVLDGLVVAGPPRSNIRTPPGPDGEGMAGDSRPAPTAEEWSKVRRAWERDVASDGDVTRDGSDGPASVALILTEDELLVLAEELGAGAVPTVRSDLVVGLPPAAAAAVRSTVVRSLLARGVVALTDEGEFVIDQRCCDLIDTAIRPDLLVTVERSEAGRIALGGFSVRPDGATVMTMPSVGVRRIDPMAPGDLMRLLSGLSGLAGLRSGKGDGLTTRAGGALPVTRVRCTWRDGSVVTGGEVAWTSDESDRVYLLEDAVASGHMDRRAAPSSETAIRHELLDLLPGAGTGGAGPGVGTAEVSVKGS